MLPSLEEMYTLFRAGHFCQLAAPAQSNIEGLSEASPEHRALMAHALFHTGNDDATDMLVQTAAGDQALPVSARARFELIRGLVRRRRGDLSGAISYFQSSLEFSTACGERSLSAWAALHHFRALAETQPGPSILEALEAARDRVAAAGDAHASAYLHDSVALMEASAGRVDEARRHLRVSQSLLKAHPNAWLEQVSHINSFFVSFIQSEFVEALRHIREAKRLIPLAGGRQAALIDCNEAHALMALGRFSVAIATFQRLSRVESATRLAALDGLGRAYLATNRLHHCETAIGVFDRMATDVESISSLFAGRWTSITRSKLLLRRRQFASALRCVQRDLPVAHRLDDGVLVGRLYCLQAEAFAGMGLFAQASQAMARAASALPHEASDHLACYYRSAGSVLRMANHPLHHGVMAKAHSIWEHQQNRCALSELRYVLEDFNTPGDARPSAHEMSDAMRVVISLGSACGLAYNPRLLGRELIDAIDLLGCSPRAVILAADASHDDADTRPAMTLALGVDATTPLMLNCIIPSEPSNALLLAEVLRIGRAALALERVRADDHARASLWPTAGHEPGAVFIDPAMRALVTTAHRVSDTNVPVLITGETGTGKEVIARLIHSHSARAKAPFLPFNCTATPREMLESQLFGHRRGSFTGATDHFLGIIRAAAGGTLFLDEIGEATLEAQPKLLRFLESGEVHPLGETHPSRVDVRIIAATNADLDSLVAERRFRNDLLYRLNIVRLHVPPLRDRRVEIPALASLYLRKFALENRKGELRLADETIEFLLLYRWPGNVRQLANEMRRLAALAEKSAVLMPEHLSPEIAASRRTLPASARVLDETEVVVRLDQPIAAAVGHLERAMIQHALRECGGGLEQTAARLGLSRKGLYLKRQRYGLDVPDEASIGDVSSRH